MKRLLREPLLHFLVIGAVLFTVFQFVRPATKAAPSSKQIQLSLDDLARMALLFQSQWKREPTAPELERLMETKVQTEILYREALAAGLDKDDEIVKRRMAQKMQFLAEDTAPLEPTTAELKSWYAKNSDKFAMPTHVSFRHLYFSPDRRAAHARDDAVKALAQLTGQPEDAKLSGSSPDPFMFQEYYRDRGTDFLGKEFGPQFALAVAKLPIGSWQGPIESGFGWHLVFVDNAIPGHVPDFAEVEPDLKTAWLSEQKALAWERAYQELRAKYTVLLPKPPENERAAAALSAKAKTAASVLSGEGTQ
jgi:peptidyl-prolyl cis-trans isomerase C